MDVMVKIPLAIHSELLGRCEITSPEFIMLKNGLVTNQGHNRVVSLLCRTEEASNLIQWAGKLLPDAAVHIMIEPRVAI